MMSSECLEKIAVMLDEEADIEARDANLYWLITNALRQRMKHRFRPYEGRVPFTFDDALQEYFLYLRGDGPELYSVFRSMKDHTAADSWLVYTFRNFISRRARYSARMSPAIRPDVSDVPSEPDQEIQKVRMLSTMIAYCCQELPLVQRFVFLRMVLSVIDRDRALPQKDVAMVLGISHVYYRVLGARVKSFAMRVRQRLLDGGDLFLDSASLSMREALENSTVGWYELIADYYSQTIDLFSQSESIIALRCGYCKESPAMVLHDVVCRYLLSESARAV